MTPITLEQSCKFGSEIPPTGANAMNEWRLSGFGGWFRFGWRTERTQPASNVTRSLSMTGQAQLASSIRNHELVIPGIETMAGHTGDKTSGHHHG